MDKKLGGDSKYYLKKKKEIKKEDKLLRKQYQNQIDNIFKRNKKELIIIDKIKVDFEKDKPICIKVVKIK